MGILIFIIMSSWQYIFVRQLLLVRVPAPIMQPEPEQECNLVMASSTERHNSNPGEHNFLVAVFCVCV